MNIYQKVFAITCAAAIVILSLYYIFSEGFEVKLLLFIILAMFALVGIIVGSVLEKRK
ncbi:hypothetical protein KQ51_00351 [Candidatus Izimaplasma bacterium HR1]|uniref:hypothetical protein n=1 Tax=Candidatus Izimoplasma sp. HR1 TaxID=1541959 RepID=UPI0004F58F7C|nr:hypothetical protein KQ51_00351 [Candidatus Izimaplasma bacterium HR1]